MKKTKELFERHNYLNKNIKHIKKSLIIEYDMQNAGPSILRHEELISEEDYQYLMTLPKKKRSVTVGKFLRDNPDISKALMDGFVTAREEFFKVNNIEENEILSIKKDAVFLINKTPKVTQVNENYLFRKKNEYHSYINIRNKEYLYSNDTKEVTTKGLSKEIVASQKDYFLNFIKECFELEELERNDDLFIKFLEFKNDFIEKKLDLNFYKDIDNNEYIFTYNGLSLSKADINEFNENLNINNNFNFLQEIISNFLS